MKIYPVLALCHVTLVSALFSQTTPPVAGGCNVFPADNIWNTKIDKLPVDPNSNAYINSSGAQNTPIHPDFGTVWNGAPNGLPYVIVPSNQPNVPIVFTAYGTESDPGPYPVPATAPIEGGPTSSGDRHVGVVQSGTCRLYEMFSSYPQSNGSWQAASGAVFDLSVNGPLRPAGWTSSDAAGLPVFPGLVRYDEVQQALASDGVLHHAIRFTVVNTRAAYLWPARHFASSSNSLAYPPMGQRFRLKASANITVYPGTTTPVSATNKVILQTLKTYGMYVADNGGDFHIAGAPDPNWNDGDLHLLTYYKASDFEAIDESSLMIDPNSGQAVQPTTPPTVSVTAPASVSGTVTISAQAQAAAGIASVQFFLDGATSLGIFTSAGPNYSISWVTTSAANGTHKLTAVATDTHGISTTSAAISVTVANSTTGTPAKFTTYFAPFGSAFQTLSGSSTVLPLRGYLPGGAAQFTYLITNLNNTTTGATEYQIIAGTDGAGGYTLRLSNSSGFSPPWPGYTMKQSATMITLPTPFSLGAVQITGYRFTLSGNEFQLDIAVTRSGTFNNQVVILGVAGSTYSSPWMASDGAWTNTAASAPVVKLAPTSLNLGTQSLGASVSQSITVSNTGTAPLSVSSVQVSGANAADFTASSGCTSSVAAGSNCAIKITFTPKASGARSGTLSIADNATGSPQSVSLTGTGTAAATPTTFTTYLSPYGSAFQTFTGGSVTLPLRGYIPGGASLFTYMVANLNATATGATEYQIIAQADGKGGYTLRVANGVTFAPAWPDFTMQQSATMLAPSRTISLGTLQITGYRFSLVGNEFQLDLSVTRTGSFNDKIMILGIQNNVYSSPWGFASGGWSN